jgi:diaminopimelate decarboxylase
MSQKLGLIIGKMGQKLAVSRQTTHGFHMERFNLKKLNQGEGKEHIGLKSQIGSQRWETLMMMCIVRELEKLFESI